MHMVHIELAHLRRVISDREVYDWCVGVFLKSLVEPRCALAWHNIETISFHGKVDRLVTYLILCLPIYQLVFKQVLITV